MGEDEFLKGLRQAYCASMRSQERRDFLTVEDVCRYRDQMRIYELEEQLEKQKKESSRLLSQSERQNSDIMKLREQLQSLKQSADAKTLNEYESLLNETMAEADALKGESLRFPSVFTVHWALDLHQKELNQSHRFKNYLTQSMWH